jgi:hypothetical protein
VTDTSKIKEHMQVVGSCGKVVGIVDRVEGISIKLTKDGPEARGSHHYIPVDWVQKVDQQVHLSKPCADAQMEWQGHPVKAGEFIPEEK